MTALSTERSDSAPVAQERSLLDQIAEETAREAAKASSRYMPTLTVKQFSDREKQLRELKELLIEGVDYGTIPGTDKPTLLLPGAQKICTFFGYVPHYECRQIEDWTGEQSGGEPRFYYDFTCTLFKGQEAVGEGRGSCNSWESKYRFRWVKEDDVPSRFSQEQFDELPTRTSNVTEFGFAIDKAETSGQYGKSAEYWQKWRDAITSGEAREIRKTTSKGKELTAYEMGGTVYRIPNEGYPDIINTVQKMGQKRAYIAATLSATGASQYFTQDVEDLDPSAIGIDTGGAPAGARPAPGEKHNDAQKHVLDRKMKEAASNAAPETPSSSDRAPAPKPAGAIPSDLPEAWVARFAALDAEMPGAGDACLDQITAEVKAAMPNSGTNFVTRSFEKHGVYERGLSVAEIKALVCEMLAALPRKKPQLAIDKDLAALGMGELLALREPEKARLGEAVYRRVLQTIGNVDKANKITDLDTLRRFITALRITPTPEHAPSPNVATDADLPEVLQPPKHTRELLALQVRLVEKRRAMRFNAILKSRGFANISEVPPEKADDLAMALNDALAD